MIAQDTRYQIQEKRGGKKGRQGQKEEKAFLTQDY